jgi:nitric oxide reductase NorQ protein
VSCHEDLTATDLVGRFHLESDETHWCDGPLTTAVRTGSICYLDEIVEARQDTVVVLHPLADHRRQLPIERLGTTLDAADGFTLVVSYNPGYQSVLKDLKPSTRQRLVAIELGWPPPDLEAVIVEHETGIDRATAARLVELATIMRRLDGHLLREVPSTRLLVSAAALCVAGVDLYRAAETAIVLALTDDRQLVAGLSEVVTTVLGGPPRPPTERNRS